MVIKKMSELMCSDETQWSDQQLLSRSNDWAIKDQQIVPILVLDDGRLAFRSDNGELCLLDSLMGVELFQPVMSDAAAVDSEMPLLKTQDSDVVKESQDLPPEDIELKSLAVYNCQCCSFSSPEIHILIQHIKSNHDQTNVVLDKSSNAVTEIEDILSMADVVEEQTTEDITEKLVFLCSECKSDFMSVDECRDHMIKEHSMLNDEIEEEESDMIDDEPLQNSTVADGCEESLPCSPTAANDRPSTHPQSRLPPAPLPNPPVVVLKKPKVHKPKEYDPEFEAKPHKCVIAFCGRRFSTVSSLEAHTQCHLAGNWRRYCCPHCSMLFHEWAKCSIHLWKDHNIDVGLYTCQVCGEYKATTRRKLASHSMIHSDERPYKCAQCDRSFKQQAQLTNHVSSVHNKHSAAMQRRWYMKQVCEICKKTYSDSKSLKKHMQAVHKKLKPYKCQICGHMSAFKSMLQLHMRQHTGEKPFACELCSFRTGDHNSLRRHIMRHTGKRPYKCPHCHFSCIQSIALKSHLASHHPGQCGLHECPHCYFTTVSQANYDKHMSDHTLNLIPPSEVEVFPENVAAAHLVYRSFGASPSHIHCDVIASSTSRDGMMQTITISVPPSEVTTDDEDTSEFIIGDTGGITIPEGQNT